MFNVCVCLSVTNSAFSLSVTSSQLTVLYREVAVCFSYPHFLPSMIQVLFKPRSTESKTFLLLIAVLELQPLAKSTQLLIN